MTTASSKKFQCQFALFIRSTQYNELVDDKTIFSGPSLVNAVTLWVSTGGLKNTSKTSSPTSSKKKSSTIDGPQCCARTYNGGGCLDGKICGRKGNVMVDGIPCCPQHSKPYPGNFKGFTDKKGVVGFCAGCSLLAGNDIIHACPQINLLGFKNDDPQVVCQPVCISRAQQHTDYEGDRLGEDKPKSKRGRKKGSIIAKSNKTSNDEQDQNQGQDQGQDQDQDNITEQTSSINSPRSKSFSNEGSSSDEDEPVSDKTWEMAEIDLGDGDGECFYWVKHTDNGMDVYTNDDINDRVKLGAIDEDGVYTAE